MTVKEDARAHVKAAQEAELAGNALAAVRHLERAALVYIRAGMSARAASLYRYCLRLAPERNDLKEALEKAEAWGGEEKNAPSSAPPSGGASAEEEGFNALAIQRGPIAAPVGFEAWCSFCCRPVGEVGPLAQGPAGAFICAGCVEGSRTLLGSAQAAPRLGTPPPARPAATGWLGPPVLLAAARSVLAAGRPSLVVVGPEGSGKSALLDELERSHPGVARLDFARRQPIPPGNAPVLVDHVEAVADPAALAALADRPFVAALRAPAKPLPLRVRRSEELFELPLVEVELPEGLPSAPAIGLPEPSAALLTELLERALLARTGPALSGALKAALVARAVGSGHGAKALLGELWLLDGLSEGAASLDFAETPGRRPRRKRA